MSLLNTVKPEQAEGSVATIYQQIEQALGFVPKAFQLSSINLGHLERHWTDIGEIMSHPTLSQKLFTIIRLLVSEIHRCKYCIGINTSMLLNIAGMSQEDIDRMVADPGTAPLDAKELSLLLFVLDAVRDSNGISPDRIDGLRAAGCSDREIFDAAAHACHMVASDIMFNAFRVEPE